MFFVFTNNAHAITYKAQIGFGSFSVEKEIGPDSIGEYITEVYKYAVSVVGILASIVLMWGGVRWLTAGGDSAAVDDAKKWIEGALSGLVLVMTSYMILYFVNPDLIKFKSIKIDPIKAVATTNKDIFATAEGCCFSNCTSLSYGKDKCTCQPSTKDACTGTYNSFDASQKDCSKDFGDKTCVAGATGSGNCEGVTNGTRSQKDGVEGYCRLNEWYACINPSGFCEDNLMDYSCKNSSGFCGGGSGGDCNCKLRLDAWGYAVPLLNVGDCTCK